MVNSYKRFVPHRNNITTTEIENLRNAFLSPKVISYNPKLPIVLQTDATDFAMGAVLTHILKQNDKLIQKLVCDTSKTFADIQKKYSTTEKECPPYFDK